MTDFMADDRAWFRRHPKATTRRRAMIEGEFPPELSTAPPGFRIEVMVHMTAVDPVRVRTLMLVPIAEGLQ
jgi:hypothetical protein